MSKFNFIQVVNNIQQMQRELPVLMANDAQKYFLGAFKSEAWDGVKWAEVDRRIPGTNSYKYPKKKGLSRRTKPILIGTGRLRREVSLVAGNAQVQRGRFDFKVTLRLNTNNVPYGLYQNDGTVAEGSTVIPARQFMGNSVALRRILKERITRYMDKVWRG